MPQRLSEIDSLMARMEQALAVNASQVVWVYDRTLDIAALRSFNERLKSGMLGRAIAPAALGAAGDSWTPATRFAPLEIDTGPIPLDRMESWLTEQSRAYIDAYGGPAWRLAAVPLEGGGAIASLLVSHAIADGLLLMQSIADAVLDRAVDQSYCTERNSKLLRGLGDVVDATRNIARALRFHVALARRGPTGQRDSVETPQVLQPLSTAVLELSEDFEIPRATALVPSTAWHASASNRGGTSTVLALAVAADLATSLGRISTTGTVQLKMPVSTRFPHGDGRANAVRGITLNVECVPVRTTDLRELRHQLKEALKSDPEGKSDPHAALAALHKIVPRPRLARILSSPAAADYLGTVVTTVGKPDSAVLRIDGNNASSMAGSLINRTAEDPVRLGALGGSLAMTVLEVGGTVALRVSGLHPPNPLTRQELSQALNGVLGQYGMDATFW
ncbi:hypothetical protein [Antrihabitans sp. YC2-6]|uniref:hypothetical protein n=1 Tax=Antrihabitans sp. YC2-6 TaxID=2799498 RepID=UPI0018F4355A|nr:hypothetical protein [Antrihabitans sp. YC2-6]MBJ8346886.1 hypothetical protein [Antrihabitans sp. YC2-6]